MIRVYVAGPIMGRDGSEPFGNVGNMIRVGDDLAELGLCPFVPGLSVTWAMFADRPRSFWLMWSLEWLGACHAVFRMDGASDGADLEVEEAERLGLPVFADLDALVAWADEAGAVLATPPGAAYVPQEDAGQTIDVHTLLACPDCDGSGRARPVRVPVSHGASSFRLPICGTCEGIGQVAP